MPSLWRQRLDHFHPLSLLPWDGTDQAEKDCDGSSARRSVAILLELVRVCEYFFSSLLMATATFKPIGGEGFTVTTIMYASLWLVFVLLQGVEDGQTVRMPVGKKEIFITFRVGIDRTMPGKKEPSRRCRFRSELL